MKVAANLNSKNSKISKNIDFLNFLDFVLERDRGGSGTSRSRFGEIRAYGLLLNPKPRAFNFLYGE